MNRNLWLCLAVLALPGNVRADVTIDSRLTVASIAGMGTGSVRTETSGLHRREERRLALEGAFASAQSETSQVSITRLDRSVLDHVYATDSTYEEVPLSQVLARSTAGTVAAEAQARGIPTLRAFFGRDVAAALHAEGRRADAVLGNNVLAHVADLPGFDEGVALLLAPAGRAVFEFPYVADLVSGT